MLMSSGIGYLGKDAKVSKTQNGKAVVTLSVACNDPYAKDDVPPTWVKVSLWGDRWAKLVPFLKKGKQVHFSGTSRLETFHGTNDVVTTLCVNCDHLRLLTSSRGEE